MNQNFPSLIFILEIKYSWGVVKSGTIHGPEPLFLYYCCSTATPPLRHTGDYFTTYYIVY